MWSSRRWIEVSTRVTASEMKPGLLPVLWTELPPRRQASSTRSRRPGSIEGGWWNSPAVVTTSMPAPSRAQTSSGSSPLRMYSTQSGASARTSAMSPVATTPTGRSEPGEDTGVDADLRRID